MKVKHHPESLHTNDPIEMPESVDFLTRSKIATGICVNCDHNGACVWQCDNKINCEHFE